jgi:hypothetical protein
VRKFVIGLIVLGVLLALYLGYTRIGGTPPAGLSVPEPLPLPATDTAEEPNGRSGRIGPLNTEVIDIKQTRFLHRNESGRVDREFGFEVFLHKQADRWRFTNPYMKLFLSKTQCHVIADTGEVQVQTAFDQLIPNDALFQGNVVIHIIPPKRNDPKECFIYLDDVTFVAEKSLFSSTGPVRFVSRSAVLEGVGLELIYDSMQSRLELFRIIELKSLRIRSADIALFSGDKETARHERRATGGQTAGAAQGLAGASGSESAGAAPVIYGCVLRGDVTIDTPERLVIARELLSITDVPWVRSGESEPGGNREAEPNMSETPAAPAPEAMNTKASRQLAFDAMPAEQFDIVVTCSGGLVIAPQGALSRYATPDTVAQVRGGASPALDARSSRQQAIAQRIEYNATTGDALFAGPVQMAASLDPNSLAGPAQAQAGRRRADGEPIPMTITARNAVHYTSSLNRVVFEGDCLVSAEKTDPNVTHSFALSAPAIVLDFVEDTNAPISEKAVGKAIALKRFSTDGGPASIVVRRRAGELRPGGTGPAPKADGRVLGWTGVQASHLEYEAATKLFTARGPGELQLINAQASSLDPDAGELPFGPVSSRGIRAERPQTDPNAFSFNQPCYAFLRDFDLLTFASDTNRIVVAAESQPILIDYISVADGKYGPHIMGDAGHLDLTLRRTAAGRMELASLVASKGITYEDETRQFAGGTLTYDHEQSLVTVVGDELQPCYFNGALVTQIEMNVTTSDVKTRGLAPSIIQGKR